MRKPPDLRELVGDDVTEEDLAELRRADALLRSVPAPPAEVPQSLTRAVGGLGARAPMWTRRRLAAGLAFAAALSALFFGLGTWTGGDDESYDARASVALRATEHAPGASGLISVGEGNASGNWPLELEVSGLPKLPPDGYYTLWLARDGEYAGTCGTFRVGEGKTTVRMSASYRLADLDEWVITAEIPGRPEGEDPPWLLQAKI